MIVEWDDEEYEAVTDSLDDDEEIVGVIDEYGTITDKAGNIVGDLVGVEGKSNMAFLVMKKRS